MHLDRQFFFLHLLQHHLFILSFLVKPLLVFQKLVYISLLILIGFFIILTVLWSFLLF